MQCRLELDFGHHIPKQSLQQVSIYVRNKIALEIYLTTFYIMHTHERWGLFSGFVSAVKIEELYLGDRFSRESAVVIKVCY